MSDDLNQYEAVDGQEEQSSEPDPQEGVVTLKLQKVGRGQPDALLA